MRNQSTNNHYMDSFQFSQQKTKNNIINDFLNDQRKLGYTSNLPSPIAKMNFDNTSTISKQDIFNFSNTITKQLSPQIHKSYAQSPQKQNFGSKRQNNYFKNKRCSVPDIALLNNYAWKNQINLNGNLKKQNQNSHMSFRKLNGKRNIPSLQNQEDYEYFNQQKNFRSQNNIPQSYETFRNEQDGSYKVLSNNYQLLQRQYQKIKEENMRLKHNKQQLMNQNLRIKKESQSHIHDLNNQIQSLKEKIYRMEMDRPHDNTNRNNNSRMTLNREGSFLSARGSFSEGINQNYNPFYVGQLQRQNQQLIRQNRRLNEIIVKRLKHSVMDN